MRVLMRIDQGRYKYAEALSLAPTARGTIRVKLPSGKKSEWKSDEILNEKYEKICVDLM